MLLRTLSIRPELLILDEPGAGLDYSLLEVFLSDFAAVTARLGIATLYIGHHWAEAAAVATEIAYLPYAGDGETTPDSELIIMPTLRFAEDPPTLQAFEAVNGPGTGIWPAEGIGNGRYRLLPPHRAKSQDAPILAAFPRPVQQPLSTYLRAGVHRIAPLDAATSSRSAWIYLSGRLKERATVVGFEQDG